MTWWKPRLRVDRSTDAHEALTASRKSLEETQQLDNRVSEVTDRIVARNQRNHYADTLYQAFGVRS